MSELNSLQQRIRDGLLLDAYSSLLTEKQRLACEMTLLQDLSLSEAAESLGVSRQGVHDLVTRSREHMENCERSLGLIEKNNILEEMENYLDENKDRLPQDFYDKVKIMLRA